MDKPSSLALPVADVTAGKEFVGGFVGRIILEDEAISRAVVIVERIEGIQSPGQVILVELSRSCCSRSRSHSRLSHCKTPSWRTHRR